MGNECYNAKPTDYSKQFKFNNENNDTQNVKKSEFSVYGYGNPLEDGYYGNVPYTTV